MPLTPPQIMIAVRNSVVGQLVARGISNPRAEDNLAQYDIVGLRLIQYLDDVATDLATGGVTFTVGPLVATADQVAALANCQLATLEGIIYANCTSP